MAFLVQIYYHSITNVVSLLAVRALRYLLSILLKIVGNLEVCSMLAFLCLILRRRFRLILVLNRTGRLILEHLYYSLLISMRDN